MARVIRSFKPKSKLSFLTKVVLLAFFFIIGTFVVTMTFIQNDSSGGLSFSSLVDERETSLDTKYAKSTAAAASSSSEVSINTASNALIKERRTEILSKCSDKSDDLSADTEHIKNSYFTTFPSTSFSSSLSTPRPNLKRCKNIVLDFGANVGDTAGHLIDAGLPNCPSALNNKSSPSLLRLMLGERIVETGRWNQVTRFLKQMMDDSNLHPEDYCYYGIEGNPHFTKRLQGIEDFINALEPSPLAHASFLTETVGAGEVGMTKLFLDTVNTEQNFWGSSIMQGHQDVKKSTGEGGEVKAHDVMGYTITKLMELTLVGLKPDATEDEKKGSHLLIKVDIEGGEYVLTQEVVQSKALCKFVEMGNTVDVVIETHSQRVTGPNPLIMKFGGWKRELEGCGVTFRNLQAWWS